MASSARLTSDGSFRRLWLAGLVGFLIRWLEMLVFAVFAYQATGSAFVVASITMLRMLPLALFGVPFGVLAVRLDRRIGLIVTMTLLSLTALVLAGLAFADRLEVWHLAVGSVINGLGWAADNPFRRGLIGELAGAARMGNAMAMDVGASNASRLVGPGLGGLLLAHAGIGVVLAVTAVLYLAALIAVLGLPPVPSPGGPRLTLRATFAAGFLAARASPLLAASLWITLVYNLFGWPVLSMVPVIGKDQLGLQADGVGLLVSLEGVGTLIGAVMLAALARPSLYGRIYVAGATLFMLVLPAVALSTQPWLTAIAMLAAGVGQAGFSVMQATLIYVSAPAAQRMPAMGVLTMCIGIGPLGFLGLGWLAERVGASWAATGSALAGLTVLACSWPLWRACWLGRPDLSA